MCNLGEGIYEEAWKKSKAETTMANLKNLMDAMGIGIDKAMDLLKIPATSRSLYTSILANN